MALPARLFCDTSFFYACFDQRDVNDERAKQLSEESATIGSALYVTWDIISETLTLLRYRRTYREALTFLNDVKPHLRIVNCGETVRYADLSSTRKVTFPCALNREQLSHSDLTRERILIQRMPRLIATSL